MFDSGINNGQNLDRPSVVGVTVHRLQYLSIINVTVGWKYVVARTDSGLTTIRAIWVVSCYLVVPGKRNAYFQPQG